jgi:serine/threonine protein kinase
VDKTQRLQAARKLFQRLRPAGWKEANQQLKAGGQASVLVVEHEDGRKGVFRCLIDPSGREAKRLERELRILTNPELFHPNIVRIIAHPADPTEHWYVTQLGVPFRVQWKRYRDGAADPVEVTQTALRIITDLSDGMAKLHEAGVVHRDIKPDNIVIASEKGPMIPMLIDFGIAHVEEEERLTPCDEAVANKRYSPDVMMNRMDVVPPWLDLFQLSQLLIWMIAEDTAFPYWDRPLDWRWVNYHRGLPADLILAIRAVTAVCSEQSTSPRNAREFSQLIRKRFSMERPNEDTRISIDIESIRRGIARGQSIQDLARADDLWIVQASAAEAALFYGDLHSELVKLLQAFQQSSVPVQKSMDVEFASFVDGLKQSAEANPDITLYELQCGDPGKHCFQFRIHCVTYLPSLSRHRNGPTLPDSSNLFTFYAQRYANMTRVSFPHFCRVLTLERDGSLMIRSERMEPVGRTTVGDFIKQIKSVIEEPEAWEAIQRDR